MTEGMDAALATCLGQLAVEIFTEMSVLRLEDGSVEQVIGLSPSQALEYIRGSFRLLTQSLAHLGPLSDTERTAYETSLQRLESALRIKSKAEIELSLQLSEAEKAIARLTNSESPTKEAICGTEPKPRLPEIDRRVNLELREERNTTIDEYERALKSLHDSQIEAKRSKIQLTDLERRLKRTEFDLVSVKDALACKTRECERWKKELDILRISSNPRSGLPPYLFSGGKKKVTVRIGSYSPQQRVGMRKNTSESNLNAESSVWITGKGTGSPGVPQRSMRTSPSPHLSVREDRKIPLLRKQSIQRGAV